MCGLLVAANPSIHLSFFLFIIIFLIFRLSSSLLLFYLLFFMYSVVRSFCSFFLLVHLPKPFLSGLRSNKCLSDFLCVAWHGVTSVSWCGIGWTPSGDSRSWQLGGVRGCRVDWILGRPKFGIYCTSSISMRSITPTSSQSVGISPVPQSPLQASPMNVEHALSVPIFTDFQKRVPVHSQSWARQLLHYGR